MPEDIEVGGSESQEVSLPKPTFTEVSQPAGSELSAEAIAEQKLEQRLKDTEEKLRREFQSKYDKDTAANRKLYGDLSEVQKALAEVKAGGDPDKVFAALEQRNLYQKVAELEAKLSAPTQVSPDGTAEADEAYEKAVGLLTEVGLTNDPEVLKLMGGRYKNPTDMLFAVNKFVAQRNTKKPASPASVSSPAGGGRTADSAESIQAEINAILSDGKRAISVEGGAKLKELAKQLEALEAQ